MNEKIKGIHHITSIVGDAQENVDFYTEVLGLRLVKKTVNFDDPGTYHLYFGDKEGSPGTIITTFPYENARPGKIGDGQVGITSYAVPEGSLDFWEKRLDRFNVSYEKKKRFNEESILFHDIHGLKLEIVERKNGGKSNWIVDDITEEVAIKGFAGAVLYSASPHDTAATLEKLLGLEKVGVEGEYIRFKAYGDIANIIDIKTTSSGSGINSVGTVHHIAWTVKDDSEQMEWQKMLRENGFMVTDVRDRNYFKSIYFREKGGILFEITTEEPGFTVDEDVETLGEELKLPSQYERLREELEEKLSPIEKR